VVECDLAKVEVAGSNPVSRSSLPCMIPSSLIAAEPFAFLDDQTIFLVH
jgi:hypothetical protein